MLTVNLSTLIGLQTTNAPVMLSADTAVLLKWHVRHAKLLYLLNSQDIGLKQQQDYTHQMYGKLFVLKLCATKRQRAADMTTTAVSSQKKIKYTSSPCIIRVDVKRTILAASKIKVEEIMYPA